MEPMTINYLAVIVAAIVYLIIGWLWYAPLFGAAWMKAIGKTKEQVAAGASAANYIIALVTSFIACYGIARIMLWYGDVSIRSGILVGVLVGVCFVLTSMFVNDTFEKRPTGLTFINVLYHLVSMVVAGIILGVWH